MDNPQGIIQSLVNDAGVRRAIVVVDVAEACPRCAAGKGCGAGLLSGVGREREVDALVRQGDSLQEGDTVEIALAPNNVLRAAAIVYGLPMLGALIATGIAYRLALGDIEAAIAALAGLGIGLSFGRWRLRKALCLNQFTPIVEKRLRPAQTGA